MKKTFSVITPALYFDKYLENAIKSVRNQICDRYHLEHLVIFDNDEIQLPKDLFKKGYKLKFSSLKGFRNGPSQARNRGLDLAVGEIVCFLDADDIWLNGYIEVLERYYSNENIMFTSSYGTKLIGEEDSKQLAQPYIGSVRIYNQIYWNSVGCPTGFSYRRSNQAKHIRFNTSLKLFEDWHFYILIKESLLPGEYGCQTGKVMYLYRISDTQSTSINTNFKFKSSLEQFLMFACEKKLFTKLTLLIQSMRLYKRLKKNNTFLYDILIFLIRPEYLYAQFRRRFLNVDRLYNTKL